MLLFLLKLYKVWRTGKRVSVCVLRVRVQSRCTSHGAVADCSIHRPRVSRAFEFGASAQVEKVVPARTKTCERCKERYLLLKKKKKYVGDGCGGNHCNRWEPNPQPWQDFVRRSTNGVFFFLFFLRFSELRSLLQSCEPVAFGSA